MRTCTASLFPPAKHWVEKTFWWWRPPAVPTLLRYAPALPANVRLERFIPHDVLLPHVDVMVTNGGYGGVQQALAHGVPLVVAGDSEEKPEVAARVRWSGAGIDLRTGRPSPDQVAEAVRRVLTEPTFRARARALQAEIARTCPLDTVTEVLLTLAETTRHSGNEFAEKFKIVSYEDRPAGTGVAVRLLDGTRSAGRP